MGFFFGALVLNFMLFFIEIEEAAGMLNKIITKHSKKGNDATGSLDTSRIPTLSASTYDQSLRAHNALDLGGHQSFPPQFYPQTHGYPSYAQESWNLPQFEQNYLPPQWTQSNQIHNQQQGYGQGNSKQGGMDWLMRLSSQKPEYALRPTRDTSELVSNPSMRTMRKKNPNRIHSASPGERDGSKRSTKKSAGKLEKDSSMREKIIQEERPKKGRGIKIREPNPSENTQESRTMNLHATGESGRRGKGKAAGQKNVSDSHDIFIQRSQHSEQDFGNFEPTLIESQTSNFNPYIDLSPYNPTHQYLWNYPGGGGPGRQQ